MKNKTYPSIRYVAERLLALSRSLTIDFYTSNKLTRAEKFYLASVIEELRSHQSTLLHYAPQIPINEHNYPRTIDDILDSDYLPFSR